MALQGAEILFYPTAIGSEPQDGNLDSREHWKRVMQGHAGANLVLIFVLYNSECTISFIVES
jgi:N-carbamoylputrescine amidase